MTVLRSSIVNPKELYNVKLSRPHRYPGVQPGNFQGRNGFLHQGPGKKFRGFSPRFSSSSILNEKFNS